MKNERNGWMRWFGIILAGMVLTGCEIEMGGSDSDSQALPSSEPAFTQTDAQAGAPAENAEPVEARAEAEPAEAPAPEPEPAPQPDPQPAPTAPVTSSTFQYVPQANSVRVHIPPELGMWQMSFVSLPKHVYIWGPHNVSGGWVTVPMSPEQLRQASSRLGGGDGRFLIHCNTTTVASPPYKSASWRILNPSQAQSGDGQRLKPGENK